jgi:hypothetical protein
MLSAPLSRATRFMAWVSLIPALLIGPAAQALPCWKSEDVNVARIRQFEVMLLIVSLRCKGSGVDITASYERFRTAQRPSILSNENKLRSRYGANSSKEGLRDYERYMTGLGNFYGAGSSDENSCRMFGMVTEELAKPTSNGDMLATFAMEMVRDPRLDSERCGTAAKANGP